MKKQYLFLFFYCVFFCHIVIAKDSDELELVLSKGYEIATHVKKVNFCENLLKIVAPLFTKKEIKGNVGVDAKNYLVGTANTGFYNIGEANSGSWNIGEHNTGNYNIGSFNEGNGNFGSRNVGNFNFGNDNKGNFNFGSKNNGIFYFGEKNSFNLFSIYACGSETNNLK